MNEICFWTGTVLAICLTWVVVMVICCSIFSTEKRVKEICEKLGIEDK